MKYLLFIVLLLLNCSISTAQKSRSKIRSYYSLINKAELSIIDSNYKRANDFYKEAFRYKEPNDKDIFNAEVVSYLVRDTIFANDNLNKLAYYGMKKMVFEGSFFGQSISTDSFYLFLSKYYDSIYAKGEASSMAKYGQLLSAFYEKDQKVRMRSANFSKEEKSESDRENVIALRGFINENGFPSFQRTGFFDKGGFSVQMFGTFYLVFWHTRPFKTPLDDITLKAVLDGAFRPDKYAFIIDHRNNADSNKYNIIFTGRSELSPREELKINKERQKIYLESIADFKRKFEYAGNDRRFELIHPTIYGENMLVVKLRGENISGAK